MGNKYLLLTFSLFISILTYSQKIKVKFKKGKVLVNGTEILIYEKRELGDEFIIYSIKNREEIADMVQMNNGTSAYLEGDYKRMYFNNEEIKIESSRIYSKGWKYVIKLLIKNKVLDMTGKVNLERLQKFAKKYDENITNRTIRY